MPRFSTRTAILLTPLLLALRFAASVGAAPPAAGTYCATHPATFEIARARHAFQSRALERERPAVPSKSQGRLLREGDVAVLEDDGTVVIAPSLFDLPGQSMQFLRRPKGMAAVRAPVGFNGDLIGERLELGDDDAVELIFPDDFRFPFGDAVRASLWVNSDGNLTFGAPDTASTARSLARFLDGPPRIAGLFADLDGSRQTLNGAAGVYAVFLPHRLRVTWVDVPEFGVSNRNNVQITLFENGRVLIAYGDTVQAPAGIVGVNPWGGESPLHLMDFDQELPRPPARDAIAQSFTTDPQRDEFAIARRFFTEFQDVYDHLVVWNDFPIDLGEAFAFQINVRNTIQGLGLPTFDQTPFLETTRRLESFVQMGSLDQYPNDPDQPFFRDDETTMSVVGHEVGHRWMARTRFSENGTTRSDLLGRQQAHWSFFLDSDGSVMEGNDLIDNGDGSFRTAAPVAWHYSALDQYLMGLIPPQAVPPTFVVRGASTGIFDATSAPRSGTRFTGNRLDVRIEDILAVEGPRLPRAEDSRKVFRTAFLLVSRGPARPASVAKVDRIRRRFERWFSEATDGNGQVRTQLLSRDGE